MQHQNFCTRSSENSNQHLNRNCDDQNPPEDKRCDKTQSRVHNHSENATRSRRYFRRWPFKNAKNNVSSTVSESKLKARMKKGQVIVIESSSSSDEEATESPEEEVSSTTNFDNRISRLGDVPYILKNPQELHNFEVESSGIPWEDEKPTEKCSPESKTSLRPTSSDSTSARMTVSDTTSLSTATCHTKSRFNAALGNFCASPSYIPQAYESVANKTYPTTDNAQILDINRLPELHKTEISRITNNSEITRVDSVASTEVSSSAIPCLNTERSPQPVEHVHRVHGCEANVAVAEIPKPSIKDFTLPPHSTGSPPQENVVQYSGNDPEVLMDIEVCDTNVDNVPVLESNAEQSEEIQLPNTPVTTSPEIIVKSCEAMQCEELKNSFTNVPDSADSIHKHVADIATGADTLALPTIAEALVPFYPGRIHYARNLRNVFCSSEALFCDINFNFEGKNLNYENYNSIYFKPFTLTSLRSRSVQNRNMSRDFSFPNSISFRRELSLFKIYLDSYLQGFRSHMDDSEIDNSESKLTICRKNFKLHVANGKSLINETNVPNGKSHINEANCGELCKMAILDRPHIVTTDLIQSRNALESALLPVLGSQAIVPRFRTNDILTGASKLQISLQRISNEAIHLSLLWKCSHFSTTIDLNVPMCQEYVDVDEIMYRKVKCIVANSLNCENQYTRHSHHQRLQEALNTFMNSNYVRKSIVPSSSLSALTRRPGRLGESSPSIQLNFKNDPYDFVRFNFPNGTAMNQTLVLNYSLPRFQALQSSSMSNNKTICKSLDLPENVENTLKMENCKRREEEAWMKSLGLCPKELMYAPKLKRICYDITDRRLDVSVHKKIKRSMAPSCQSKKHQQIKYGAKVSTVTSSSENAKSKLPQSVFKGDRMQIKKHIKTTKLRKRKIIEDLEPAPMVGEVARTPAAAPEPSQGESADSDFHEMLDVDTKRRKVDIENEMSTADNKVIENDQGREKDDKQLADLSIKPCIVKINSRNSKKPPINMKRAPETVVVSNEPEAKKKKPCLAESNPNCLQRKSHKHVRFAIDSWSPEDDNLKKVLQKMKLEKLEGEIDVLLKALTSLSRVPTVEAYFILNKIIMTFIYECLSSKECSRITHCRNYSFICRESKQLQAKNIDNDELYKIEYKYEKLKENTKQISELDVIRNLDEALDTLKTIKKDLFTEKWLQKHKSKIRQHMHMVPIERAVSIKAKNMRKSSTDGSENEEDLISPEEAKIIASIEARIIAAEVEDTIQCEEITEDRAEPLDFRESIVKEMPCSQTESGVLEEEEVSTLHVAYSPRQELMDIGLPLDDAQEMSKGDTTASILADFECDFDSTLGSLNLDVMPDVFNTTSDTNSDTKPIIPAPQKNSEYYYLDVADLLLDNTIEIETHPGPEEFDFFSEQIQAALAESSNSFYEKMANPYKPCYEKSDKLISAGPDDKELRNLLLEVNLKQNEKYIEKSKLSSLQLKENTFHQNSGGILLNQWSELYTTSDQASNSENVLVDSQFAASQEQTVRTSNKSDFECNFTETSQRHMNGHFKKPVPKLLEFESSQIKNDFHISPNLKQDLMAADFWRQLKNTPSDLEQRKVKTSTNGGESKLLEEKDIDSFPNDLVY